MTESQPVTRKGLALALLAAAQFIVILDASIVNVALPSIGRDLDFSQENLSWVVNAYTLVFGGFLLLGGRMADLLGRRRVFTVGLILFAIASLLGGLAASEGQLIAARDVLAVRVAALGGEDGPGRLEDALAIAARVGPEGPGELLCVE